MKTIQNKTSSDIFIEDIGVKIDANSSLLIQPNRLLNKLFCDENFLLDSQSLPMVIRDIVNMNYWNTCDYLLGYQKNKRVCIDATFEMKLMAILLKEYYRFHMESLKDSDDFEKELQVYITAEKSPTRQLKIHSMKFRRNLSQFFHSKGEPTWLDCTSRATMAWKYVVQNGYVDFDKLCRLIDGNKIVETLKKNSVYPDRAAFSKYFKQGKSRVKSEILSQKKEQAKVCDWVEKLGIKVAESRLWLFEEIKEVRTDPFKSYEKALFNRKELLGNNEIHYLRSKKQNVDFSSLASDASSVSDVSRASSVSRASHASSASNASGASRASDVSRASHASYASRASNASSASSASRASSASSASNASRASDVSHASSASLSCDSPQAKNCSWFNVEKAIGELKGLDHPPIFEKNKFALSGHWKINKDLAQSCQLGWLDPFCGHGETPLYASKIGKNFVGIEINEKSMNGYIKPFIEKAIKKHGNPNVRSEIRLGDSSVFQEDLVGSFDLCYTSPPYFKFEEYDMTNPVIFECEDYDEFHERVTKPVFKNVYKYLVSGGILALQTEKDKTKKNNWIKTIESLGFKLIEDTITGREVHKYSIYSKRDQSLLIFDKPYLGVS